MIFMIFTINKGQIHGKSHFSIRNCSKITGNSWKCWKNGSSNIIQQDRRVNIFFWNFKPPQMDLRITLAGTLWRFIRFRRMRFIVCAFNRLGTRNGFNPPTTWKLKMTSTQPYLKTDLNCRYYFSFIVKHRCVS